MTTNSIIELTRFLLSSRAKYVLTERFNQDPLERAFGMTRAQNRRGKNPTYASSLQSFRTIRGLKVFQPIKNSNIIDDESPSTKRTKLE